jgi:maltose alpha-D-glucosyltransferase/alpha-amylase
MTPGDLHDLADHIRQRAGAALDRLKEAFPKLPDDLVETASAVISLRGRIGSRLDRLRRLAPECVRIRVHGDYHLGRVLRTGTDFVVTDFDGDPTIPLPERRARQSALKDVAGMLRSFSYASQAALLSHVARRPADLERLAPWADLWEQSVSRVFLQAYLQTAGAAPFLPAERESLRILLEAFLLAQALRELRYELDHRPGCGFRWSDCWGC